MRFRRLEVRSFRAVDEAELALGPGLNVLHGPNDLGKSTLAAAVRAALLVPADSSHARAFAPWHDPGPPSVRLTFEREGSVYRVHKVFGAGAAASARLEVSPDGSSFHEEERGRAVDRRLRELLRWGIEAPGGRGVARGLPESFLSHVLLGMQGDVPMILDRSLDGDREGSGRERLHEALQALAQDPTFKRVLDAAQAKVDEAFTPTGRRRTGQTSPFVQIRDQIAQLAQEHDRLTQQRRESEEVQARIQQLADERLGLESERALVAARVASETEALGRLAARAEAAARHERAALALKAWEVRRAELSELGARLAAARSGAAAQEERTRLAAERLRAADAVALAAERAVLELTSEAALAAAARDRERLEAEDRGAAAALEAAEQELALEREIGRARSALAAQAAVLAGAERAEAELRQQLALADTELERARELGALLAWRQAAHEARRARAAAADGEALAAQAAALRERASAATGAERSIPELAAGELGELRELESEMALAAARLEVGLSLALRVPAGQQVRIGVDGGALERTRPDEPLRVRARSRIIVALEGGAELEASAGDPALRARLEALERGWAERARPLLEAAGVPGLDALARRLEEQDARRRQAAEWLRDAAALEARAAEKRELGADAGALERRAAALAEALGGCAPELDARFAALGAELGPEAASVTPDASERPALEARLEARRAAAAKKRLRLEREVAAQAELRVAAVTRQAGLEEARDSLLRTRRDTSVERAGSAGAEPDAAELERERQRLVQASAAARAELERERRERTQRTALAARQREQAVGEVAAARAEHEAASAASREARERLLTLDAQVRERALQLDEADEAELRGELEVAAVALEQFQGLDELTAERLSDSRAELARLDAAHAQVLAELRRAEGALGHVGGDVVASREQQTHEALEQARTVEVDREREYEAYRLLLETLRTVESEQGVHLGRALEAPVSQRFARLTEGRYREVALDGGLGFAGVAVSGQPRAHRELSEGTREQLATILRLCIAEYLDTALVLDDHLAQTHRRRADWFRSTLREAAGRIQIVVLTARPEDYLSAQELCEPDLSGPVRVLDLEQVIRRARYGQSSPR